MSEHKGTATYSPEDNKLRLYIGRVPRDEFLKLRADGWVTLHKQREAGGGDFAATWTPSRRDTALEYAGIIEDEDMGPAERAADRAERFGDYRDKRTGEATGHADRYDSGPVVHGYQSEARAECSAARHDRIGTRAVDAWSKAEYWTRRTAGVISHALHVSSPGVRMGRIKTLEAELRKCRAGIEERKSIWQGWQKIAAITDPAEQTKAAVWFAGHAHTWADYMHPRPDKCREYYRTNATSLYSLLTDERDPITGAEACAFYFSDHSELTEETDWTTHLTLRLAYENQMIEAQGGRAAFVEMQAGGWIGSYQIRKVNKSNATGRVVSVNVLDPRGWSGFTKESGYKEHVTRAAIVTLNIERLKKEAYRPPTPDDIAKLEAEIDAEKAKAPKKAPCPLVNPTEAEAERLQAIWNERAKAKHCAAYLKEYGKDYAADFMPATVCKITQAIYSANSKGAYARAETEKLCANATLEPGQRFYDYAKQVQEAKERGPAICQIRTTHEANSKQFTPHRVIILTDKPQKALPAAVWKAHKQASEATAEKSKLNVFKFWNCACGFQDETSAVYDAKICPKCGEKMHDDTKAVAAIRAAVRGREYEAMDKKRADAGASSVNAETGELSFA